MKIEGYTVPKSSFLSVDKDMGIIAKQLLSNPRLKRLLYYTTKDALDRPNLTDEQSIELFGKNIKNIPKLYVDGSVLNYIIIGFDNFTPNRTNPEFRDNIIEFDIICHYDQWALNDFQLRPYRIAAEIDSMFDGKHLTGIGETEFLGANQIILTDEFAGLCLMFRAVHGDEDKKNFPNPEEDKAFREEFKSIPQLG
jgi:hypothetical protein